MWDKIVKYFPLFPDAVLTGVDTNGYPVSMRCQPDLDMGAQVLRIQTAAEIGIQPGPGSLLCHSHDEKLWSLKAFVVRGTLERNEDAWIFHPTRLIPGIGLAGTLGTIRMTLQAPRAAKRYLQKRNLPYPSIDWDKIKALASPEK